MSWFSQVSQGPCQRQAADGQQFTAPNILGSPYNPTSVPAGAATPATQSNSGAGLPSPGQFDLPSAPQAAASPPSLENLSCAGQDRQPEPISYVTFQEQRCVLSWFQGWNDPQKERFLQDLVGKALPGKVCTLLDSLSTLQVLPALLQVKDKLPNIFECQLRLWTQWFESWGEEERNHFLHMLEEKDPMFVAHFYRSVAGTAGRD
ncbi:uncharacterized protein C14orf119 homolog isoform X1 [Poecilia reticulata]|uniref:uncharacterized protein C14orf119 homolog isoform X1 n=1 Tax=Poecilia reticulata TaxID=8081 RepID=UPI0007EB996D|nr:PREDICTED: uncharacterized protein C14orf119 homolog isoform X1 [Poecilia reticulata]